jgi:protein-disulfide isomerase
MKLRDLLNNLVTAVLVVCAVLMTAAVVKRNFFSSADAPLAEAVKDWQTLASRGQRLGATTPTVTVVEFSDFQCPFCSRLHTSLQELLQRYPDDVQLVYRHLPLTSIHRHAKAAAVASECAAEQGRFGAFATLLYDQQDSIGSKSLAAFAAEADVRDSAAFSACVDSKRYLTRVEADMREARRRDLSATPTVFVNNLRMPGTPSLEILDAFVRAGMGDAISQLEVRAYLAEGDTLAVTGKQKRIAADGNAP